MWSFVAAAPGCYDRGSSIEIDVLVRLVLRTATRDDGHRSSPVEKSQQPEPQSLTSLHDADGSQL